MPDSVQPSDNPRPYERRLYPRKRVWFPSIQLGEDNGGIILDINESGLAMQAVRSFANGQLPAMRFQLSESQAWIETRGRIAWISTSKSKMGVEFVGLPEEGRNQIRQWIPRPLYPSGSEEENRLREQIKPEENVPFPSKQESVIVVPESEATRTLDEHQGRHSIAEDPAGVLCSIRETQSAGTVLQHIGDESTELAVIENSCHKIIPSPYLSYSKTTPHPEIYHSRRTGVFLTAAVLLSASFLLASRSHRNGTSSRGTKVMVASKVPELSSDSPASPKTTFASPSLPLDQAGFVLQVGAMTHEENASALAESLRQRNFPVVLFQNGNGRFYRVAVGPYSDVNSTLRVKEELRKRGFNAFRVPWNPLLSRFPTLTVGPHASPE